MDCDYNEGVSILPNPWLMKVSSFYFQKGYEVSLITSVLNIKSFDKIVIAKEEPTPYLPSPALLTAEHVDLIGRQFIRQPRFWEMPPQVYAARPDYTLYKFDFPSELTEASFLCFSYKGRRIRTQNQIKDDNSLNIVIDKHMWSSPQLDLILDDLAKYNKLIFLEEVDFSSLKTNDLIQKFTKLRLNKRPIKPKKVSSIKELEQVLKIIKEIKKVKNISIDDVPFITMARDLNAEDTLERYFIGIQAAALANKYEVRLEYLVPREDAFEHASVMKPFLNYKNYNRCFFEHLAKTQSKKDLTKIFTVKDETFHFIEKIKEVSPKAYKSGFVEWGGFKHKMYKGD